MLAPDDIQKLSDALSEFAEDFKRKTGCEMLITVGISDDKIHYNEAYTTSGMDWSTAAKLSVGAIAAVSQNFGDGGGCGECNEDDVWEI